MTKNVQNDCLEWNQKKCMYAHTSAECLQRGGLMDPCMISFLLLPVYDALKKSL